MDRRRFVTLIGALCALQWTLAAQAPAPAAAKRPLTYDVVDAWRSIQGTQLSADGQWLACALTAPGEDGEVVGRNVRTGATGTSESTRQAASREKRKEPGADLIVRNLVSGEEVTISEVTEYQWDKNGDWIAYAVSSNDASHDGAFARHVSDRRVKDASSRSSFDTDRSIPRSAWFRRTRRCCCLRPTIARAPPASIGSRRSRRRQRRIRSRI